MMLARLQGYHLVSVLIITLTIVMAFTLGGLSVRVGTNTKRIDEIDQKVGESSKAQADINKLLSDSLKRHRTEAESIRREVNKLKETRNDGAEEVPAREAGKRGDG